MVKVRQPMSNVDNRYLDLVVQGRKMYLVVQGRKKVGKRYPVVQGRQNVPSGPRNAK